MPDHRPSFPPPTSISPEAQQVLAAPFGFTPAPHPAPDDIAGWQRWVADNDEPVRRMYSATPWDDEVMRRTEQVIDGVHTYVLHPAGVPDDAPVVIELHGGGLILCGGEIAWRMSTQRASRRKAITWVPDYRMPPVHRYPAALDDCVAVYRHALTVRSPERIAVSGASAGGNLAAALTLRAHDENLPRPSALLLMTPELDLTESGDTFSTLLGVDHLGLLAPVNRLYADGHDLTHPYLSPLFGDVSGFPPTFLQSGTRDLYLSNTVRMHRKLLDAGVPVELRIMEAGLHGGFGGRTPEDHVIANDMLAFLDRHLAT